MTVIGLLAQILKATTYDEQKHRWSVQMTNPSVSLPNSLSLSNPSSNSSLEPMPTISTTLAMAKSSIEPYFLHERIAQQNLSKEEKEQFDKAGLLRLYSAMQKPVDEEIAKEAVQNYDGDKQQTVIQKVVVKATKD